MSGQQFIETLQLIGYTKARDLSARNFDWMFEDAAVLPFLSWFCDTVGQPNVLSKEETQAYAELERSEEGVLEGPLLQQALQCMPSPQDISAKTLKDEIEDLKVDVEKMKERKERLVKARNTLSLHYTGLTHKLSKFSDVEAAKKQEQRHSLEKCQKANAGNDASLQRLVKSVQGICSLYTDIGQWQQHQQQQQQSAAKEREEVFLSQVSLDPFHAAEDLYSKDLTRFTKKLFFEGIADIAGGELSRYRLLEVSDVTSLLVKGQSEQAFHNDCQELARLQSIFAKSEGERINALVGARVAASVSQAADDILRSLRSRQFPTDVQDINRQVQETKVTLANTSAELRELTDKAVVALVRELGSLHGTSILTGDYTLKLARQTYFTSNQDQVIKYLVEQRARNEFLTMAYEVEARHHRHVHRLLTAVQQTLHQRVVQVKTRLEAMKDPAVTKERYNRGTIDTRDTATTRLHHLLVPAEGGCADRKLFLAYSSLVDGAQTLSDSHAKARAHARSTAREYTDKLLKLEREVCGCEDVLYSQSSTVGGLPVLMPAELLEASNQVDHMLRKLEAAIMDVVTDINEKKKALKKDALQTKGRELFVYFHQHPERLKQTMESLERRLEAHQVQAKGT